jgi:hypothetical protein
MRAARAPEQMVVVFFRAFFVECFLVVMSEVREAVSIIYMSGWNKDWSASVLACMSFAKRDAATGTVAIQSVPDPVGSRSIRLPI